MSISKTDEDMAHQIITATNSETKCHSTYISEGNAFQKKNIQFGSFSFVANHEKTPEVLSASHAMSCNIFVGSNILKDEHKRETRPYVKIGSLLVEIKEAEDHIQVAKTFPRAWHTFLSSSTRPHINPITKLQDMEIPIQFGLGLVQPDRHGQEIPYLPHTEFVGGELVLDGKIIS